MNDHVAERSHVSLQEDEHAHEHCQRDAVEENVAENVAFAAVPIGCGAGDDDALGIDHFAHDSAGAVGSGHEDGGDVGLLCGYFLEASK